MDSNVKLSWPLISAVCLVPIIMSCSASTAPKNSAADSVRQFNILQKQVDLAPSFNASITDIRFFEGERSQIALINERKYMTRFARERTRSVYTEIHLQHLRPDSKVHFPITLYFRQNGRTVRIEEFESRVGADWTSSDHVVGVGEFEPGKWRVGNYEVDIYLAAQKAATAYFQIY